METHVLDDRAKALIDKLTNENDELHGRGSMSCAIYDTAWVSMVTKSDDLSNKWLFPESFTYLLNQQCEDGSWESYASQIDGILNTAASLLALRKHLRDSQHFQYITSQNLQERIRRATSALGLLLQGWDVEATIHVGFEILVPSLLTYLEEEGIHYEFPGRKKLFAINAQKLAKFKPEYLYTDIKSTALHSLEAFIGKLDFDRIQHHKVNGAFMASPSSTAAYLINSSTWDDDCETYLRNVVACGAGKKTGGIPSAFPSTIFELTWALSTLAQAGFDLHQIAPLQTSKAVDFLSKALREEHGLVGFAPYVGADADDTAKTILSLNLLGSPTSPTTLIQEFEGKTHFKTYQQERDPSFSANCNVLNALLHAKDPSEYIPQIEKALNFLCDTFRSFGNSVRDKWNISPFYSFMLMMQTSVRLTQLWNAGRLSATLEKSVTQVLSPILTELCTKTLHSQNWDGSWGKNGFKEETAYAVLVLAYSSYLLSSQDIVTDLYSAIEKGRAFLNSTKAARRESLWIEKVTYTSDVLSESYILAALHFPVAERRCDSPLSVTEPAIMPDGDRAPGIEGLDFNEDGQNNSNKLNSREPNDTCYLDVNGGNGSIKVALDDSPAKIVNGAKSEELHLPSTNGTYGSNAAKFQEHHINGLSDVSSSPGPKAPNSYQNGTTHVEAPPTNVTLSENERILLDPFHYLEQQPGKDMRSQFIHAFNLWLNVPAEKVSIITRIVKMLHTASLLIDDIEDSSVLRRGIPVAHSIFGIAQTLNSGNYVYFLALQEVQKLRQPHATNVFLEELLCLHRGQGMDLYWRDALICPSEQQYLDMVGNKTGGLFRLAIKLMQVESPHDRNCEQLVNLMGWIFQIRDDYMNLFSTTYTHNKGLCEDLTEGKFSFPIIHSIRTDPQNHQLMNILKQKSSDERIKKYAVSIMEKTGSFDYTRRIVQKLKIEANELVERYEAGGWGSGEGARKMLARMDMD